MSRAPAPADPVADPARDRAIAERLEAWFPSVARDLPWRRTRTPWAALVSELMLQQTQVARVVPAFERFMAAFPDPAALAAADEEAVLSHWAGLGYYRRARFLHRAAKQIVERHGGEVPADPAALLELTGVGRYTAGAVASIAFGLREPIVDGNVHRVVARLDGTEGPADDPAAMRRTWSRAEDLVAAAGDPAVLNESLMELGATVCTPANPRCTICPVAAACVALSDGRTGDIPAPKRPARRTVIHLHTVLVRRADRVLVEVRPDRGLWAGLWQPPSVESPGPLELAEVTDAIAVPLSASPEPCGGFVHRTTHREVIFHVYAARSRARRGRWVDAAELAVLPIGNGHRRAIELAAT